MKKETLTQNIQTTSRSLLSKLKPVTEENFYLRIGNKWSIAENLAHLTLSAKLFNRALKAPKPGLLIRFGVNLKPFRGEEWLDKTYHEASFPQTTGFEPRMHPDTSKAFELDAFVLQHEQVTQNCHKWSDLQLDYLRLPHVVFGYLSVREYLLFMEYHIRHHQKAIDRILSRNINETDTRQS